MADPFEPCRKQYHREGEFCVHNRNPKQRYRATRRPVPKGPVPNPTGQPIPNPTITPGTTTTTTQEPFSGTISPAVAQGSDSTGTTPAASGGDMTGTSAIVSEMGSVFGSGAAATPQYNYGLQTQQNEQAAQTISNEQPAGS